VSLYLNAVMGFMTVMTDRMKQDVVSCSFSFYGVAIFIGHRWNYRLAECTVWGESIFLNLNKVCL